MTAQGLIDTTEMYLRTLFELEEAGSDAAARPHRAGAGAHWAAVSQPVARMDQTACCRWSGARTAMPFPAGPS